MKTASIALMLGLAAIVAAPPASAGYTLEWDASPPGDGAVSYAVEKKLDEPGENWELVAETTAPVMGISTVPSGRTLYRLKITNPETGVSVYDPNVIADRPVADLNFRFRDDSGASIEIDEPRPIASLDAIPIEPATDPPFDMALALIRRTDFENVIASGWRADVLTPPNLDRAFSPEPLQWLGDQG